MCSSDLMGGLSRRDACLKGVGEIGLAVTTATLTTVIVFLPALLIDGEMRFMLYRLALPVVSALLASLGVALVFIPLCVYMTLPPATTGTRRLAKPGRAVIDMCLAFRANTKMCLAFLYEKTFVNFNQWYNRALGHFLKRRIDLVFILIVLLSVTYFYGFKQVDLDRKSVV